MTTRGLSQEAVAAAMGISTTSLWRSFNGDRAFDIEELVGFARISDVKASEIMGWAEELEEVLSAPVPALASSSPVGVGS
jgi:transcriptional regulator with XRE-family HTH domain